MRGRMEVKLIGKILGKVKLFKFLGVTIYAYEEVQSDVSERASEGYKLLIGMKTTKIKYGNSNEGKEFEL